MKSLSAWALGASVLLSAPALAQLSFGGHPYGVAGRADLPEAPLAILPTVDAEALKAEDAARDAQGIKGPFRFGFNHATDLSLENSGLWHALSNGDRVWRLAIECPGAYSINFEFHDYVVPEGAQVFVYNELGDVLGAFEEGSNPGQTVLGVTQLAGERITIEYVEPASVRGRGRLRVGQVTHAYRDIMGVTGQHKGLGDSGDCNNNVICPIGDMWRAQIRSVAMITVGGSGQCTGQLINNCDNDGTPYFLTANHCLQAGNSNTWVFRFNWQSPQCAVNQNGPTSQTVSGSTLKVNSAGSDVALLELNTTPPSSYNVFYTGWDKTTAAAPAVVGIHHPSGDIKKISFENQPVTTGTFDGAQCWRVAAWDDGTTEGGSSGSGLWDQSNGLLVGQLFGGQASCDFNFNDYYGKFSVSYPLLEPWLGSCGDQLQGFPNPVGIDETIAAGRLSVAPNPTNGRLSIALPQFLREGASLVLYDALGQVVLTRNVTRGTERVDLDLNGRTEGIYLLEVTAEGVRTVERVVLTR